MLNPNRWYSFDQIGFKFEGESSAELIECTGKLMFTPSQKVITWGCRGTTTGGMTFNTGEGDISISAHIKREIIRKIKGMSSAGTGVYGIKRFAKRPNMCVTARLSDTAGMYTYVAFPESVLEECFEDGADNSNDEVGMVEMDLKWYPDDDGFGMYEQDKSTADDSLITNFSTAS